MSPCWRAWDPSPPSYASWINLENITIGDRLFFLHIPKTGGTALSECFGVLMKDFFGMGISKRTCKSNVGWHPDWWPHNETIPQFTIRWCYIHLPRRALHVSDKVRPAIWSHEGVSYYPDIAFPYNLFTAPTVCSRAGR